MFIRRWWLKTSTWSSQGCGEEVTSWGKGRWCWNYCFEQWKRIMLWYIYKIQVIFVHSWHGFQLTKVCLIWVSYRKVIRVTRFITEWLLPTQEYGVKVVDMSHKRCALLVQDFKVLVLAPPIFRYVTPLWAIPTAQTHLIVELNNELFHSVSNRGSHVLSF